MKKLSAILVFAFLIQTLMIPSAFAAKLSEPDDVIPDPVYGVEADGTLSPSAYNCEAAIVIDADTNEVLFEKEADTRMFPASITKVMTCLLTLEYAEKTDLGLDEMVKVTHTISLEKGAVEIWMRKGEEFSIKQLLHALMLKSANDTAVLLAEHIGGSVEGFADMMNDKAAELGMTNTHFVTPNGLHNDNHYVSARDMARLMQAAIQNETFRNIIGTLKYTIPATAQYDEPRYLTQGNRLIKKENKYYYEYCLGGKTGYTSKARYTFVCYGEKDGRTVIAVVLHSPLTEVRFASGKNLLKYGLENFKRIDLAEVLASERLSASVSGALEDPLAVLSVPVVQIPRNNTAITVNLAKDSSTVTPEGYECDIQWRESLTAPIAAGTVVGTATYTSKSSGKVELICDLATENDITAWNTTELVETVQTEISVSDTELAVVTESENSTKRDTLSKWIVIALIIVLMLLIVVFVLILRSTYQHRKREEESRARQIERPRNHYSNANVRTRSSARSARRHSDNRYSR